MRRLFPLAICGPANNTRLKLLNCKTAHQRFNSKEELSHQIIIIGHVSLQMFGWNEKLVGSCSEKFDALNDLKVLDMSLTMAVYWIFC